MNIKFIQLYAWTVPFLSFIAGYGLFHHIFHLPYVKAPALIGKTLDQAMPLVTNCNLNLRLLHYKEDMNVAEGTILDQTPAAFQKIKPHQSLFIILAKKPPAARAPNTYHKTVDAVTAELATCGITPEIVYITGLYPYNQSIAQMPAVGHAVRDGRMLIYASDDSAEKVIWPLFVGKRVSDVKDFLVSHGICMEVTHSYIQLAHHTCTDCIVVDQRPLPGSLINLNNSSHLLRVQVQAN